MKALELGLRVLVSVAVFAGLVWMFWNPNTSTQGHGQGAGPSTEGVIGQLEALSSVDDRAAFFLVTGSVVGVRLRAADGREHGPGTVAPGSYQIISDTQLGPREHGAIVLKGGQRKRIHCTDGGCTPWQPK